MTAIADIDPPSDVPDTSLDGEAATALDALHKARPSIADELAVAGRGHVHLRQERQRDHDAQQPPGKAGERPAGSSQAPLSQADWIGALERAQGALRTGQ